MIFSNPFSKRFDGETLLEDGIRWHVRANARALLTADALRLEEHICIGTATVVKHGPHRTVYRVSLSGLNLYWKRCRITGLRGWLRQCMRPPKARMEFDRALALAARGIHTVEPLAWGARAGEFAGESFLITREIVGAVTLYEYLLGRFGSPAAGSAEQRRALAAALGEFVARIHEAGVIHPDLHPGNILVVPTADGLPNFHLIDLHDIRLGSALGWRTSRANLQIFNRWFALRAGRSDRRRFWATYAEVRRISEPEMRKRAREIEAGTALSNRAFWSSRATRCLGTNRYFRRVHSAAATGHAVRDFDEAELRRFLDDPDFPFRRPGARLLKDSRTSRVVEMTIATAHGPRAMIYKRFNLKKRLGSLLNHLRSSPALRSWKAANALLDRQLPTPRPWLVLQRRGLSGPREGYLLCEKVDDAHDLVETFSEPIAPGAKWESIAELARLMRRFHELRLTHHDLKAANILLTHDGAFHFIDLVGVAVSRRLPGRRVRCRDLARLCVSSLQMPRLTRIDQLRFLRSYLNWGLCGSAGWKTWWRMIAEATQEKLAKNRRRGRPLA
jgi:tRNA A-37 threonylcarbamoyl transferase component Bud32